MVSRPRVSTGSIRSGRGHLCAVNPDPKQNCGCLTNRRDDKAFYQLTCGIKMKNARCDNLISDLIKLISVDEFFKDKNIDNPILYRSQ